ncbi:hypothetical protein RSSM_01131 [Rhodopirellula sallentina SM41]|uniref:BNR repeat-containing family member n=1 Tax=Rhodopirellula sallentina SM41 TaxID=1263870 RepID=M5U822_9BACT|nr:hypothetical protein RSSM_01131 [Rhodopirellula sallentina SM41]
MIGHAAEPAQYDRDADRHEFTVFMKEGGWCWYQDPRAILHDGKLFIGSVQGNGAGPALVGVYDVAEDRPIGLATMNARFDHDDHNSPVFHVCPDGRVLAVYARHNRDRYHYSRYTTLDSPLQWSDEQKHERVMASPRDNVTYMNLFEIADGSLAIFFRGINFDPSFVTSNDCGETWNEPVHFFQSEVGGRHRPYARYTGGDDGTVHVAITDAHPRDYGNSIYYFCFRDGQFFSADNTRIKSLERDGPLRPSETERVYQGTGKPGRGPILSAEGAAWTSSIAIDKQGHPHIGYTVYRSNQDQRYRIASWNGEQWIDREVAFGGNCLYDREASYTGLITLDPVDPTFVVISTDVDPSTGKDLNGQHEIYRAQLSPADNVETIQWTPITHDSHVKNIRPVIVRDETRRVILWNRGDFQTYTNYQLDTVGLIETK